MKKITFILFLTLVLVVMPQFSVYAKVNFDGSGSAIGSGDTNNNFQYADAGVRVTVFDKDNNRLPHPTLDFSNKDWEKHIVYWFGCNSKLAYTQGQGLTPSFDNYRAKQVRGVPLPPVIGPPGTNKIAELRKYFERKGVQEYYAGELGITSEEFAENEYKFLVEPVQVFKYHGVLYAMTATEAAMYNGNVGNQLFSVMGTLTHRALPLSMYLQESDFGIPTYTLGSFNVKADFFGDAQVKAQLGVGVIYLGGDAAPSDTIDYIYRVDTDVITAVNIEAKDDFAGSNKFDVTFSGLPIPANSPPSPTSSRTSQEYAAESGTDQIAWIKWHTPDKPGTYAIDITTSDSDAKPDKATLTIVIEDLSENVPPNPLATDREPNFSTVDIDGVYADFEEVTSLEWTTQTRTRNPDYDADDPDNNEPKWEWNTHEYSLSMENSSGAIKPAASVPNTVDGANAMRSGYGIESDVTSNLSGDIGINSTTSIQTVIVTFPEFGYQDYNRILDKNASGWSFKENPYSLLSEFNRVHFTPVWYPDEADYACAMVIRDVWTPVGELKVLVETAPITIEGSVFDDWHVRPTP